MPTADAMSRVLVASKPLRLKSFAAAFINCRRRLPSSRSSSVLRGRPRARFGGAAASAGRVALIYGDGRSGFSLGLLVSSISEFHKASALYKVYTGSAEN